ncbi:MAG: hypothetical protein PHI93_06050 [Kiritimatiellae bacterium]|nr:hypothetical protein [Kiritimatiellia bacterium]
MIKIGIFKPKMTQNDPKLAQNWVLWRFSVGFAPNRQYRLRNPYDYFIKLAPLLFNIQRGCPAKDCSRAVLVERAQRARSSDLFHAMETFFGIFPRYGKRA